MACQDSLYPMLIRFALLFRFPVALHPRCRYWLLDLNPFSPPRFPVSEELCHQSAEFPVPIYVWSRPTNVYMPQSPISHFPFPILLGIKIDSPATLQTLIRFKTFPVLIIIWVVIRVWLLWLCGKSA